MTSRDWHQATLAAIPTSLSPCHGSSSIFSRSSLHPCCLLRDVWGSFLGILWTTETIFSLRSCCIHASHTSACWQSCPPANESSQHDIWSSFVLSLWPRGSDFIPRRGMCWNSPIFVKSAWLRCILNSSTERSAPSCTSSHWLEDSPTNLWDDLRYFLDSVIYQWIGNKVGWSETFQTWWDPARTGWTRRTAEHGLSQFTDVLTCIQITKRISQTQNSLLVRRHSCGRDASSESTLRHLCWIRDIPTRERCHGWPHANWYHSNIVGFMSCPEAPSSTHLVRRYFLSLAFNCS